MYRISLNGFFIMSKQGTGPPTLLERQHVQVRQARHSAPSRTALA